MTDMMQGFPPSEETRVTLANWRESPFSSWGFSHVREILPTVNIANDRERIWPLSVDREELGSLKITDNLTLNGYLDATWTDGFIVIYKGKIVCEEYRNSSDAGTPHILMSVSKSMLGVLAGILQDNGMLDVTAPLTQYVPEMETTAWKGASVQNLLDMRAGIEFSEDYTATSGAIIEYRKSTGWNPLLPGETPSDLRSFFQQIKTADGPHQGRFHYVSPNTDLMAWVIERATNTRYADLMSQHLWQPMGAGNPAYITVDRFGAPRSAGGMCVTLRDLARVGLLVANGGKRGTQQVIPASWIHDVFNNGDPKAWEAGDFASYFPGRDIHYRNKWYIERGDSPMAFCVGIHGQNMYILPNEDIVIAKTSSRPGPLDPVVTQLNLHMVAALRHHFK